eukprot:COSAG01_NODE_5794_length_4032_cov_7.346809_2_plen_90_part_00
MQLDFASAPANGIVIGTDDSETQEGCERTLQTHYVAAMKTTSDNVLVRETPEDELDENRYNLGFPHDNQLQPWDLLQTESISSECELQL